MTAATSPGPFPGANSATDADAAADPPEILVSRQLAEERRLAVGDVVRLSVSPDGTAPTAFRVVGVFEPRPDPMLLTETRHEVRLHLPDLLDLAGEDDRVDRVNVALRDGEDRDAFAGELAARRPDVVATPTGARPGKAGPFVTLRQFHRAIAIVAVFGSTAFLLALTVIRADERRDVAGILRVLGCPERRIRLAALIEGVLLAIPGAAVGIVLAFVAQGIANAFFQWHYDTSLVFVRVTGEIILQCLAVAVPIGVLTGWVASWTLARGNAVTSIRR